MDSKLQIISGNYRGRKLALPDGARPTQNLARIAIFNMLTGFVYDWQRIMAWDAFAGSGALGIEILSRCPDSSVIFTDTADESVKTVQQNISGLNIDWARYKIDQNEAVSRIWKYGPCVNLVFVDPPYANPELGIEFVAKLAERVRRGTLVVQEIEAKVPYLPDETKWEILRDKKYGRARFIILRRKSDK